MKAYRFSVTVNGAQEVVRTWDCASEGIAVFHARSVLLEAVNRYRAQQASCALVEGDGEESKPVGTWECSIQEPAPKFEPAA